MAIVLIGRPSNMVGGRKNVNDACLGVQLNTIQCRHAPTHQNPPDANGSQLRLPLHLSKASLLRSRGPPSSPWRCMTPSHPHTPAPAFEVRVTSSRSSNGPSAASASTSDRGSRAPKSAESEAGSSKLGGPEAAFARKPDATHLGACQNSQNMNKRSQMTMLLFGLNQEGRKEASKQASKQAIGCLLTC